MADDYCELCDLPLSQCVHGMPPEPVAPPKAPSTPKASTVTRRRAPASSGSSSGSASGSSAAPARATIRRFSNADDLAPWILRVLQDEGGEATADDVLDGVETLLEGHFRAGDQETGPTGEVRWRTAARKARKALADEGLLVAPSPGVWALTDRGRLA